MFYENIREHNKWPKAGVDGTGIQVTNQVVSYIFVQNKILFGVAGCSSPCHVFILLCAFFGNRIL